VQILRVRLADGVPLSFDETYLPEELGGRVMANDLATEPIFSLLEERYSTPLLEADYQLESVDCRRGGGNGSSRYRLAARSF